MTTRKITAFLMCPAANGDASGGTPAASAASGGHIKKGAWVSAHEAALAGLAQVIPGPLSRALPYCYENKAKEGVEAEEGPEESGGHSGLGFLFGQSWTAARIAAATHRRNVERLAVVAVVVFLGRSAAVGAREVAWVGQVAESNGARHLVVGFALRAAVEVVDRHDSGRPQFRPLLLERVREHFLSGDGFLGLLLYRNRKLSRWQLVAIGHIAQMSRRGVALVSEDLAILVAEPKEVGSEVHAPLHHSVFWLSTPFGVVPLVYSRA
jgi:hypothetical protein